MEYRPGSKVAGYAGILADHADRIATYAHVALFDDDIETDAPAIAALFDIASRNGFRICQPSLTLDSNFSYAAFLQNRYFVLRHINFIEMMCPIFRSDVLLSLRRLFEMGFESGIDLAWCSLGSPAPTDHAVIDAIAVRHTRRVAGEAARNGFHGGRSYETDIQAVLTRFDLPWFPCRPFDGIRPSGAEVSGRMCLIFAAFAVVPAIWRCRDDDWRTRLRGVAVHFKHLATARGRAGSVS
ncbi:hypothetical protein [uncultured Jannaschia sp.]|uniref:hypothetical protein n=1 Tax=uncultured Jannaschia sp. TaxID=293347 RepID=UPI00261020EA|nr:hypothetical protein [uncultured Jannaschia sp.]